jgi:flagellin-like protein
MKKIWAIRKDAEGVSPVIATILMVAITVVLAAVLYVMVLGFGTTSTTTPTAIYQKSSVSVTNGVQINIVSITKTDVPWSDVSVQLTDGTAYATWTPVTDNLDDGTAASSNLTDEGLGSLTVFCWVYDVSGNGFVSGSDYIRVWTETGQTAFASTTTYTLVLLYESTGENVGTGQTFTG